MTGVYWFHGFKSTPRGNEYFNILMLIRLLTNGYCPDFIIKTSQFKQTYIFSRVAFSLVECGKQPAKQVRAGTDFPTFKCKTCPCKTGKLKLKVYKPVLTKQQHWSQEDLCRQCWHSSIDTSSLPTRQWTFRLVYKHFKNKGNSLSLNNLSCSPADYCKQVSPWITDYNWQRFKTKENY